jgi:hypothetical protein
MPKDKPIHELRLGAVKAAIWKNNTDSGIRFNVTFSRLTATGKIGSPPTPSDEMIFFSWGSG